MLNFRIPLVTLVGKLLRVCVIFADADEIDLQLKRTVGFVSQGEANGVHLQTQTHSVRIKPLVASCAWCCV